MIEALRTWLGWLFDGKFESGGFINKPKIKTEKDFMQDHWAGLRKLERIIFIMEHRN
jgi:hypothetical protein